MSLHIMYTNQCKGCDTYYMSYEKGIKCPNCGLEGGEVMMSSQR